jgi:23S rRNA pseudouridine2605 synthase
MQRKRSTAARQNVKPSGSPRAKKSYDKESPSRSGKSFSDKPYEKRKREDSGTFDKPKRSYSSEGKSSFKKSDSNYSDRPKRTFSNDENSTDRQRRSYSDSEKPAFKRNSESSFDKPKRYSSSEDKPYAKKSGSSYSDRPKRTFSKDENSSDRPRRSYSDSEKPAFKRNSESSFDKPKRYSSSEDKPYAKKTGSSYSDRPKRTFSKDENSTDRPRKEAYSDRKPFDGKKDGARPFSADKNIKKDSRPFRERTAPKADIETEAISENTQYTLRTKKPKFVPKESDGTIRLNRYISNSGVCSRREADELISQGLVTVNGIVVTEMGVKVMPTDSVKYDGKTLKAERNVYVLLNKPKDFITTTDDPQERKTVMQLVSNAAKERIYPVGRLDRNTTGLLLFTNDGELAEKLTHPSRNVAKVYEVVLDKPITNEDLEKIKNGVRLFDGIATVDDVQIVNGNKNQIGIEIHIGRNRIVRRIFEHLGYEVVILDRVSYAGLTKKDLPRGSWRILTEREANRLKNV